ncbi:MAG: hypothetical protein OXN17_21085 [Candidatus Poribacteria bacterium]|nr:hypothetical protein [Candidatus Poribacteria bacterium]
MNNKDKLEAQATPANIQESAVVYSPSIDPEELEMLNDPEFMKRFEKAKADISNGTCRKWEDVKRKV